MAIRCPVCSARADPGAAFCTHCGTELASEGASAPDEEPWFGRYRLGPVVGRGGMGVVYRAHDPELGRDVALKVLQDHAAGDPEFRRRFLREVRVTAALEHPNVIPVHDAGEVDGHLYLAMRLVKGRDLRSLLAAEGPLAPERVARLADQLGNALDAAHARGLVHRDVKPANVLLAGDGPNDHAYLTDFGIARDAAATSELTVAGQWLGSVDYAAPEQATGRVDARTDVYALSCTLFSALTGHPPFAAPTVAATRLAHARDPFPSVGRGVAHRAAVDAVLARGAATAAEDRQPSAGDLGRELAAALLGRRLERPEQTVATGSALPARADDDTPTRADPAVPSGVVRREPRAAAVAAPRDAAPDPVVAGGRRWPVRLAAAAAVAVGATAAVVVVGSGGGGGSARSSGTSAPARAATAAAPAPRTSASATSAAPATTRAATTSTAAASPSRPAGWPAGRSGYTVALASVRSPAAADRVVRRADQAGIPAGVLRSDEHPGLRRGFYVVFAGVDGTQAAATARVPQLRAAGFPDADARPVSAAGPPDGPVTRHDRGAYTIELPATWRPGARDVSHGGVYVESRWHPPGELETTLLVDHTPGFADTPAAAAAGLRAGARRRPGYRELGFGPTTVGPNAAWRWEFLDGGVHKVDTIVTACGTGYAVLARAPEEAYGRHEAAMARAVDSLRPTC